MSERDEYRERLAELQQRLNGKRGAALRRKLERDRGDGHFRLSELDTRLRRDTRTGD